jgi:hypothetical protein
MAPTFSGAAGPASVQGGTITFVGYIVGPNFDVGMAPIASGTQGGTPEISRTSNGIKVTFSAPNGDVPGATLSFAANDAMRSTIGPDPKADVVASLVDPKGRVLAWQPDGHYHLRSEGGVLSLSMPHGNPKVGPRQVTMTMSYQ